MAKYKLMSWNVNGIRACVRHGFLDWLQEEKPHVICLQETKAHVEQLEEEVLAPKGYKSYFFSGVRKGYSGTAIFVKDKFPLVEVTSGLGKKIFDDEGRTQILESEEFFLINGYYPNGGRDHSRVDFKLEFSRAMVKKALQLKKKTGKEVILTGDFNTAHKEIDLKNPKSNKKSTGFLPHEREFIDEMLAQGFVDIFREKHPDEEGHYTWWTYRGDCRKKNVGWRIDYFFVTEGLRNNIKKSFHKPEVLGSDHCPLGIEISL
ncbi:MAG: exodeoxyribonuclease III [Halobacteriovorax sp.]|nr:exodeoxyribonuclease III [Halobacteriovorax sp.]|tara:strand:+ start:113679 stop:114464 length:786 start_codon:yes stop_codon:yes gene_type:complete